MTTIVAKAGMVFSRTTCECGPADKQCHEPTRSAEWSSNARSGCLHLWLRCLQETKGRGAIHSAQRFGLNIPPLVAASMLKSID